MDPPSLVDSVEIYGGPTLPAASFPLEDEYCRSSVTLSSSSSSGEMMRPPSPWLLDSPRLGLSKRRHDVNGLEIDPASIAFYPENWKLGQNLHPQTRQGDATIAENPRLQYPDATPKEWQRETPVSAVATSATLRAIKKAGSARSKRRMAEHVDGAATRKSKRRKGSDAALNLVSHSSKKRTASENDSWQRKFELLCAFQRENGHCRVPRCYIVDSIKLGKWVKNWRHYYKNYKEGRAAPITEEHIAQLNSIGFEWKLKEKTDSNTWQHKFELLCAFQCKNGHCRVPQSFIVDSIRLGIWVMDQRNFYKKYKEGRAASITEERIAQLNSIGFEWRQRETKHSTWQHKFELLCAFQRENGHCRVPKSFVVDSIRLGKWVNYQRELYKKYKEGKAASITEERLAQLNSIGFDWRQRERKDSSTWQHKFELLCAFQRENGHCRVPQSFAVDSMKLGQWVKDQRMLYKKYKEGKAARITEELIAQLNSIGFEWRLQEKAESSTWQHKFELLCAFQCKNGHCRVPQSFIVDSIRLGIWVNDQRMLYKKYKEGRAASITEEHIAQLNSIGFEWRPRETKRDTWQQKFQLLCAFQRENGHCRVPRNFAVDSMKLGQWVGAQRSLYKNFEEGKDAPITEERIAQLNSIGFEWRLQEKTDSDTSQHKFELCEYFNAKMDTVEFRTV